MLKIIIAVLILLLPCGIVSLHLAGPGSTLAAQGDTQCTTWEIKNNCCFKFFNVLQGNADEETMQTREKKALAEFRRCLRKDVGCSSETVETKAKTLTGVRSYCE